jgi:hypothetical protein
MNKIATLNVVSRFKVVVFSIVSFLSLFSSDLLAQINYTQNWNSGLISGWSTNWSTTTSLTCEGANAVRRNIYSSGTAGAFLSPDLGVNVGSASVLTYSYKITNWSAGTVATPNTFGSIDVQYSSSSTGPWTTIETINSANHVVSTSCATRTVNFTPPMSGTFFVRFNCTYGAGDYWMYFDNVSFTQAPPPPCSGTPAPGSAVASATNLSLGQTTNLSLQNIVPGSGVTYQWQSGPSATGPWTNITGATASTLPNFGPSAPAWYQCIVTCTGSSTSTAATSVFVNYPPPCAGTPAPGNTIASATSLLLGQTTNFTLQGTTAGTGVTYQWQSGPSATGPWTNISGATAAALNGYAPTATAWYQCVVTCTASSAVGVSTPVQVNYIPLCLPAYSSGTLYGDLISNVAISGPGLSWSNPTGTTNGTPSYVSYTNLPPVVMQAATSYSMTVTAGSYSGQGFAVWIDANDDNVFAASEKVGFSASTTSVGFGSITFNINLPCTPPLGIHRMRVRGVWLGTGSTMDPCLSYGYGEAEDYLVQFVAGVPFTPTFTAAPTTQSCTYVDYTYTTQTNNQNYVWSFPGTANVDYTLVSGGTATSNTAVVKYLVGGFKTVTVNYQNLSGCNSTGAASNTITVQQTVQVASSTGAVDVCAGSNTTFANVTPNGTWSSANTAVATVNPTTGVITGVGAGTTNITYAVANPNTWCAATTNLRPITVKPTPVINAGADVTICAGNSSNITGTVQFTVSCSHSVVFYDTYGDGWNGGTVDVIVDGATVVSSATLSSGFGPQTVTFNASVGSSIQVVLNNAGSWPSEIYWDVLDGAGVLLVDDYYPNTSGSTWTGVGAGCAPLTPVWSPAAGLSATNILNPVATPTATTTYTLSSTAPNGCIGTDQVVVTVNALPANGPVLAPAALCAGASAVVSNSVSNGVWTTSTPTLISLNAATGGITGIAAGTATVSYTTTGANGCTKVNSANITINPLPVAVVSSSNGASICQGTTTVLSAPAAASYSWNNGSTASSLNISNGGTYSVVLTSAAGCVSTPSAPYTVTVNPLPTANVAVSGPTVFCAGGSVTLTASGGNTYAWSNNTTAAALNVTQSGTYTATVTSAQGCSVTTPAINVTVNALPVANIVASGPLSYCQGGSLSLTATGIGSYQWSNGSTAAIIPITASGTYSYTITNAAGCSATSTPAVVQINPVPTVTAVTGNNTVCMGGTTTYANATTGGTWSSANSNIASVNAAGLITGLMAGSSTINYTVTNSFGCSTTASKTIIVNPVPAATTQVNGNTTFCTGGSVTLVAPPADSYLWSNNATTQSITVNASGSYSVTATLSGCVGTSIPVAVTVNALPSANITASAAAICPGASATLSVPAAATYLWSNGALTQSIATSTPGTYTVTVTNANGCSATSAPVTISAAAVPSVTVTPNGPVNFCTGSSVVLNSSASAGSSYLWSNGATTPNITASTSGVYFVTVTNAAGCQTMSNNIVVNAQQAFTASATALSPTTVCQGTPVTMVASPGATYLWSNGATTQGVNVTTGGPITVTVTSASGCTATSAPINVTVLAVPNATINASGPLTFCEGASVNLTATGGSSYHWSTGANTASISANAAGNYVVTVTAANGCTDAEQVTVNVNAVPSANVVFDGNSVLCPGETLTLTAAPGNTYAWSTGATTNEITVSNAGTYGVTVTGSNGCSANSGNIVVTAGQASASTLNVTALDAYTLNGVEYMTSGTFTQVIQNEVGCDSTITLNLTLTAGINELNGVAYEVYPNPTADQFTIDASQAVYGAYSIQDAQGKLVKEGMMNGVSTTVDLNEVARGIYFLRIAETTEAIRIIKN